MSAERPRYTYERDQLTEIEKRTTNPKSFSKLQNQMNLLKLSDHPQVKQNPTPQVKEQIPVQLENSVKEQRPKKPFRKRNKGQYRKTPPIREQPEEELISEEDDEFRKEGRKPKGLTLEQRLERFAQSPRTLREVLEKFTLQEMALERWLAKRPVLIGDFQTLERALSRINAHEIRSLPVVNESKVVIGMIDIVDIANDIAESLKNLGIAVDDHFEGRTRNDFMTKSVGSLLEKRSKPYLASNQLSLFDTTIHFVRTGQDRFMIVDRIVNGDVAQQLGAEERLDGIVTQSDVIRFLAQNIALLREETLFQKTVEEMGLGKNAPLKFYDVEIARNAFIQMAEEGVSTACVISGDGKLIGNLNTSDLKGLNRRNCLALSLNVGDFLNRDWRRAWWSKPVCISLKDPLYVVVLLFVACKQHRLFILDNQGCPIGEISQMDIIKLIPQLK